MTTRKGGAMDGGNDDPKGKLLNFEAAAKGKAAEDKYEKWALQEATESAIERFVRSELGNPSDPDLDEQILAIAGDIVGELPAMVESRRHWLDFGQGGDDED